MQQAVEGPLFVTFLDRRLGRVVWWMMWFTIRFGGVMMGTTLQRRSLVAVCALLFLVLFATAAGGGASACILTTTGETATGSLSGISPVIRLNVPWGAMHVGPRQALDIPLTTIRQISIDFPRVIIETATRVYVGPFSAFSGIDELITLRREGRDLAFPTASLRAIALRSEPFRQPPREWIRDNRLLVIPAVIAIPIHDYDEPLAVEPWIELEPAWNGLHPMIPPPAEEQDMWWVVMLVVATIAVLVHLILGG